MRFGKFIGAADHRVRQHVALLAVLLAASSICPAAASVCQFNQASGPWNSPANWLNCTGGNGSPLGTPGPADRAEITGGRTAILPSGVTGVSDIFLQNGTLQGDPDGTSVLNTVSTVFSPWGTGANALIDMSLNLGNGFSLDTSAGSLALNSAAIVTNSGTTTIGPVVINGAGAKIQMTGGTAYRASGNHTMTGGAIFQNTSGVFKPIVSLTVDGTFVNGGNIEIPGGVTLTLADATAMTQTDPVFSLFFGDGILSAPGQTLTLPLGGVRGPGLTFNVGTLQNTGAILRPFNGVIGVLTVSGNYVQSGTGSLEFQLTGTAPTQYDRLVVGGTADFNYAATQPKVGLVWTTPVPNINDFYDVITYGSRNGNVDFIGTTAGRGFNISYPPGAVRATAVSSALDVTNTADAGVGSLRAALTAIQSDSTCLQQPYLVKFVVSGTIQPLTALPAISCSAKVTAEFAPGAQANTSSSDWNALLPLTLDGAACGGCDGLIFNAANSKAIGINFANWSGAGVVVNGSAANMSLQGNYFYQGGIGVNHLGAANLSIGAQGDPAWRNVFVHATNAGIVSSSAGTPLQIQNNLIGAGAGLASGPNAKGISINGANNAVIAANVIANNTKGIVVSSGTGINYDGINKIFANGIGVDLGDDGPTANDEVSPPYDTDSGPNQRLNFPNIISLTPTSGTSATVNFEVKSSAGAAMHVFFCRNPGGSAQCEDLIGGTPITTDANGFFAGNFGISGLVPGTPVTMFARADGGPKVGNMSEISPGVNFTVAAPPPTYAPASLDFGSLTVGVTSSPQTATFTNTSLVMVSLDSISFNGGGAGFNVLASSQCQSIGTLAPGASCTFDLTATPNAPGPLSDSVYIVTTPSIIATPPNLPLTVNGVAAAPVPPTIALSLSNSVATINAAVSLTFTITTPVANGFTSGSFALTYPAGIVNAPILGLTNGCGGSISATAGGNSISGSGLALGASNLCQISINVGSAATGTYVFSFAAGGLSTSSGSNVAGSTTTLTVTSTPTPGVTLSPPSVAFGARTVNTTSPPSTVTLSNSGGAPLTISSITSSGDFAVVSSCPLGPSTLGVGLNCPLDITFTPLTVSASLNGNVTIVSDAPGSPHIVPLSGAGTATPVPTVTLNTTLLNFFDQLIGTPSAALSISVYNSGFATLNISNISLIGNPAFSRVFAFAPAGLSIVGEGLPTAPLDCSFSVPPGSSCNITIVFTPTAVGAAAGQVSISTNAAGSPHIINLIGNGISNAVPTISVANNLNFGDQIITTGGTQTLNITNGGGAPLTVSSLTISGTNASNFVTSGTCASVVANASCPILITFTPTTVGAKSAQLTIASNASNLPTATITLSGTGILAPRPIVELSATTIGYGNAIFGGASGGQVITLNNTGGTSLQIQNLFASGDFVVMSSCPAQLAGGASCVINVTFNPLGVGQRTGELVLVTNAQGSPHRIPLTGTGCRWFSQGQRGFFLTVCG